MKKSIILVPILTSILSIVSFADSVTYTPTIVNLNVFPNDGTGENAGLKIQGGGVSLQLTMGTPYEWLNVFSQFAPGSPGIGSTNLLLDSIDGGHVGAAGFDDIQLSDAVLFVSNFTFPTNGQSFTIYLPASISNITGTVLSTGQQFTLVLPPGKLKISFEYDPSSGMYLPGSAATFTTVPEPSTMALMGTGLLWTLRRTRQHGTKERTVLV